MGISFEFGTLARHTACGIFNTSKWHAVVRSSILGPDMLWVPLHVGLFFFFLIRHSFTIEDLVSAPNI